MSRTFYRTSRITSGVSFIIMGGISRNAVLEFSHSLAAAAKTAKKLFKKQLVHHALPMDPSAPPPPRHTHRVAKWRENTHQKGVKHAVQLVVDHCRWSPHKRTVLKIFYISAIGTERCFSRLCFRTRPHTNAYKLVKHPSTRLEPHRVGTQNKFFRLNNTKM